MSQVQKVTYHKQPMNITELVQSSPVNSLWTGLQWDLLLGSTQLLKLLFSHMVLWPQP